jgi:hypothetical protein
MIGRVRPLLGHPQVSSIAPPLRPLPQPTTSATTGFDGATGSVDCSTSISRSRDVRSVPGTHRQAIHESSQPVLRQDARSPTSRVPHRSNKSAVHLPVRALGPYAHLPTTTNQQVADVSSFLAPIGQHQPPPGQDAQHRRGGCRHQAAMPMDAYRAGDEFVVTFDLPGVSPEAIELDVEQRPDRHGRTPTHGGRRQRRDAGGRAPTRCSPANCSSLRPSTPTTSPPITTPAS